MTAATRLAIVGGTGALGAGLALRWAKAGYPVAIGSRTADKAQIAAELLLERLPDAAILAADNRGAAHNADIVVVTVPFAAQEPTLHDIRDVVQGKIVVDVTVPLQPPQVSRVHLPPAGSAAQAAQAILGDGVKVVSAFQNVSAQHLQDLDHAIDCDVLVCGNDVAARETVIGLAAAAGMKGWHAGVLANAVAAESLTAVLIAINRRYKIAGAGLRIVGETKA
ncbi:MAG: NADPH-dependent F420 reductase [Rhodospirillales bacterium]